MKNGVISHYYTIDLEPGNGSVARMARPLRIEKPGGWYHVSVRGNERKSIFRDDRDRRHFLEVLAEMVARFRFRLHGYVLMNNRLLNIPILAAGELSVQFSRLRTSVVRGG